MQNKYVYCLIVLEKYTIKEYIKVVKIRLKRLGYKKNPSYRIVVIDSRSKREGTPIEELGHYNPKTKEMKLNVEKAKVRLSQGAQASETVMYLINNANADGSLNYKKPEVKKLSKKAQAKLEQEKAAEASAETPAQEAKEEA